MVVFSLNLIVSCVPEEESQPIVPKSAGSEITKIKQWFQSNEQSLRVTSKAENLRTEPNTLILPYFEKEPDWDKFQNYTFPDGREVYEISLKNSIQYFPQSFQDSLTDISLSDVMVQNIMFIKHPTEERFDPLIARYFPADEFSARKQKNISYNNLHQFWSGRIDIFTYDEHHFIGFEVYEGEITRRITYGTQKNEGARITSDCREIEREVVWTTGSPGPASEDPLGLGVEFHSIIITETFCANGDGDGGYPPNTVYEGGRPYYQYADNIGGTCSSCEYKIPIVTEPENSILLQIEGHPCATDIMKKLMKASVIKSSVGELNQMNEIIQLLNGAADFDFIVLNSETINPEKPPFSQPNAATTNSAVFNTATGKKEGSIPLSV